MAPHSSTLAWKIPLTEEPGRLQSMGSLRVGHDWLPFHFSPSCIGEGNGDPFQCSCLENPRDGGAWWAAVYGVTQSRTRLKWLSSSSSSSSKGACQVVLVVKNLPAMQETWVRSLGWEDSLEEDGNPLQYSCLENPMDRWDWLATVHRVAKSQTQMKWLSVHAYRFLKCGYLLRQGVPYWQCIDFWLVSIECVARLFLGSCLPWGKESSLFSQPYLNLCILEWYNWCGILLIRVLTFSS